MKGIHIQITRNFLRNLDGIESFLSDTDADEVFQNLLDDLFRRVIQTLKQHPDIGINFLQRRSSTHETATMNAVLRQRLGTEAVLRELIRGDFIILYARRREILYLLTIKHHRQLSFDFFGRWDGE